MEKYRAKCPVQNNSLEQHTLLQQHWAFTILGAKYGLANTDIRPNEQVVQLVDQEYNAYIMSNLSHSHTDPLVFWEMEHECYPTIFQFMMDYLLIQPSAVPCEHAFSSSSLTDTKQRNQISPILMEALHMLKYSLKQQRPSLKWRLTTQQDMLLDGESGALANALSGSGTGGSIDQIIWEIATDKGDSLSQDVCLYY